MSGDPMFDVVPRNPWDSKNAELLAAIINRPAFVNKVKWAVQEYVNKFLLKEILLGMPVDQKEVDDFFASLIKTSADDGKTKIKKCRCKHCRQREAWRDLGK